MPLRQDPRRAGAQLRVTVHTVFFLQGVRDSVPSSAVILLLRVCSLSPCCSI